ncbi:general secretion pathway protein GspB [Massilia sp. TWP1-3-3]|uniref:general secretion pathway protein GspB n=1 Tax=Massilia sp. TWP1-3-3 TaxID=2804573 RepID=UPI003CF27D51
MSYILEALKKAQAERQLGSAPTLHAMPIQAAAPAHAATSRTALWIALGCAAVLAAGGAVAWWRNAAPAAPAVLAVQPAPAEPPVLVAAPQPPPVIVVPPVPVAAPAPVPLPAPLPARVAAPPVPPPVAPALARAAPMPAQAKTPPPAPEPSAPEENLPFMSQLPEPQRGELPKVTFGGYMYSKNPADRLLLIDKVLRHEGEEVAPGLILEQLLPKAAVMNYRGTRYRVAY